MAKKKLFIQFDDNSKIEYTIPSSVPWQQYWLRHAHSISVKLAWVREYPFKSHEPILLKGELEDKKK